MSGRNSTGNKFATVRHAPNHGSVGVRGNLTKKQPTGGRLQAKTERLQTTHHQRNNAAAVVKRDKNCQSQSKATNKATNNGRIALQH